MNAGMSTLGASFGDRCTPQFDLAAVAVFHCAIPVSFGFIMKSPPAAILPVFLVVALLAGCEHARTSRIQEHAALYASLDPFSKKLIRDGLINLGFTSEAVYMALGRPNRIATTETPDGSIETWSYKNYLYGKTHGVTVPPPGATVRQRDRKSTRLNSSHSEISRMPSSA